MKRIYLVRHAKSSWKDPLMDDYDRPLNKRGKHDAPMMGQWLKDHQHIPELMISSSAKRAIKTAKKIAKALGYPKKEIVEKLELYEADVMVYLKTIKSLKSKINSVMMIGHNPTITLLSNYLTKKEMDNIPTTGIFCVDFSIDSWTDLKENEGKVVFFNFPKKVKNPDSYPG